MDAPIWRHEPFPSAPASADALSVRSLWPKLRQQKPIPLI
jgi:hypothetical protein